ncbi:MAG: outer membrane lipoprotein-sorting protein [Algoriphagus sp.]|nr:outer membrane lipoprotein-sorting protein [Algoriphagus sp.]
MTFLRILITTTLLAFCLACSKAPQGPDPRLSQPEHFKKVLAAHGDWEKWVAAKSFSFAMVHETTLEWENHYLSLMDGKVRIDADLFQAGNDGDQVWISPSRKSFPGQSVRFYHNLYSTFLSIPYTLTDTLVTVTLLDDRILNGVSYTTLEAKMKDGNLLGPSNRYELLIDSTTGQVAWVLFAVTFFDKGNQVQEALKYEDYRNVDGMIFPRVITGYLLDNDSTTRIRYQSSFTDVYVLEEELERSLFKMPKQGVKSN